MTGGAESPNCIFPPCLECSGQFIGIIIMTCYVVKFQVSFILLLISRCLWLCTGPIQFSYATLSKYGNGNSSVGDEDQVV